MSLSLIVVPLQAPSLDEARADDLNQALRNVEADARLVVLSDVSAAENASAAEWAVVFEDDPQPAGLLVTQNPSIPAAGELQDALPRWMPAFLPPVAPARAAVLRRESVSDTGVGKFEKVPGALREWFVRAVRMGQTVTARAVDRPDDAGRGERDRLPALRPSSPGRGERWMLEDLKQLDLRDLLPQVRSPADAVALQAGLLQARDFLDESHEHSQSVEGEGVHAAGDYWHAIMHRREPDYSNSKYWFRRVGPHPLFAALARHAAELMQRTPQVAAEWGDRLVPCGRWDPFAFVDLCQACPRTEDDDLSLFARELQWVEMLLLLGQTCRDAAGVDDGKLSG